MTNIDMSKMTHAIVHVSDPSNVVGLFPSVALAKENLERRLQPHMWKVIPIGQPAPKYPKAERPTHCVVDVGTGAIEAFGTDDQCKHWLARQALQQYFVATCDRWWVNGGAKWTSL